ncbi:MAG: hypothetical protein FRX49_10310 [Trebouxia sp. A1-2]|nr:MAG: hypothetical protein FRX49_10310 [Trebouxia sp. A1-2]
MLKETNPEAETTPGEMRNPSVSDVVTEAASMMRPRLVMGLPDASTASSLGNRDSAAIDMSPTSMQYKKALQVHTLLTIFAGHLMCQHREHDGCSILEDFAKARVGHPKPLLLWNWVSQHCPPMLSELPQL